MGIFNSLLVLYLCPVCGQRSPREVQFRYGDVWQHQFVLGSPVIWSERAIGDPGATNVLADAWMCECPTCGDDRRCLISIRNGRFFGVGAIDIEPDLPQDGWVANESDGRSA